MISFRMGRDATSYPNHHIYTQYVCEIDRWTHSAILELWIPWGKGNNVHITGCSHLRGLFSLWTHSAILELWIPWGKGNNVHITGCSHLRGLFSMWNAHLWPGYCGHIIGVYTSDVFSRCDQAIVVTIGGVHITQVFTVIIFFFVFQTMCLNHTGMSSCETWAFSLMQHVVYWPCLAVSALL